MNEPIVIGIAGGTGSRKKYFSWKHKKRISKWDYNDFSWLLL